jgi:hypothetical protein
VNLLVDFLKKGHRLYWLFIACWHQYVVELSVQQRAQFICVN